MGYLIEHIGFVRGGRAEAIDDDWGKSLAVLELDETWFGPECVAGLSEFSHAEVIFLFDQVDPSEVETGARHPRGNTAWPLVGIFAQRGKSRPNRLGVCVCRIVSVEGLNVTVEGLDAIDGTPVIDIKPVMKGFLPRGEIREPVWADELMKEYW